MPYEKSLERAKELKKQGCNDEKIKSTLMNFGATANEADKVLREIQSQENLDVNLEDFNPFS